MPNTKPVGVAYSDPELVSGTTVTGATVSGGTISGATITDAIVSGPVTTVAAAGSTNADAAAIAAATYICVVTAADGTKGVILPTMVDGQTIKVKNNAGSILKIYPFSGAAINGLTATTGALSMAANTIADFTRTSSTQVYSTPLLPS
jgi:hypothetical protein